MTLGEWIHFYETKTKNPFQPHPNFHLLFLPEYGFCEIALEPSSQMVMAYQLCGDGKFWKRIIDFVASVVGYTHCGAICIRHIKPYIRFFGFHIVKEERLADGSSIYYCENKEGTKARCAPAWKDENGLAYYVTWEIDNGNKTTTVDGRHELCAE